MLLKVVEIRFPDELPVCKRCGYEIAPDEDPVEMFSGSGVRFHCDCFQAECTDMFNNLPK